MSDADTSVIVVSIEDFMENIYPDSYASKILHENAGYTDAMRVLLCALIKTPPDKPALLLALREIHNRSQAQAVLTSEERIAAFDRAYAELISWAQDFERS